MSKTILDRFKNKITEESTIEDVAAFIKKEDIDYIRSQANVKGFPRSAELKEFYEYFMYKYLDEEKEAAIRKIWGDSSPTIFLIAENLLCGHNYKREVEQLSILNEDIYKEAKLLAKKIYERGHDVTLTFALKDNDGKVFPDIMGYKSSQNFSEDVHLLYDIAVMLLTEGSLSVDEHLKDGKTNLYAVRVTSQHRWVPVPKEKFKADITGLFNGDVFSPDNNIEYIEIAR